MRIFAFLIAVFISCNLFSAQISIVAKGYAGETLKFKKNENFLSSSDSILKEVLIPPTEKFIVEPTVTEPTRVFFDFDIYQGWLIIEPTKNYRIILPEPSNQNTKSPYFNPVSIHLLSEDADSTSINFQIEEFLMKYNSELDKHISKLVYGKSSSLATQIIEDIEHLFGATKSEYFKSFRELNYATVELLAQPRSKKNIVEKYIQNSEIMYDRAAYADVFNQLFSDFFTNSEWATSDRNFIQKLNAGDLISLQSMIAEATHLNEQTCGAIILLNMESLFFSRQYNPKALLKILKQIESSTTVSEHQAAAKFLNHKFLLHLPGSLAPVLNLPDLKGNLYNWEDFYFKYVYLYFASDDTLTLNKNIKYLENISNTFFRELDIVIVVPHRNAEELAKLINQSTKPFITLLTPSNGDVYKKFDVQVFPTFYLVDPKGKIAWFYTPWPEEKFAANFKQLISK